MKKIWLLPLVATLLSALPVLAQDGPPLPDEPELDPPAANQAGGVGATARAKQPDLIIIDSRNIGTLRTLVPGKGARAISINTTRAAISGDATAWNALSDWVKAGGTVFLHTDAAQLFGYATARPRAGNARVAGQFWGRARAVAPFGSHPLLQGAVNKNERQARNAGLSAVRVVYYQLEQDDVLAISHPAAVPLLEVTDLAITGGQRLYAAAAAPYGRGWAIFTPGFVEQDRADGGLFVYNLMKWAGAVVPAPGAPDTPEQEDAPLPTPVNLSAKAIELAATAAQGAGFDASATGMSFVKAIQPIMPVAETAPAADATAPDAPKTAATADEPDEIGLPLSRAEFGGILQLLGGVKADDDGTFDHAKSILFLLRARLARQQGDYRAADQWLGRANGVAAGSAEASLFLGLQYAEASDDRTLAAGQRASLLANAVEAWRLSLTQPALVKVGFTAANTVKGSVIRNPNAPAAEVTIDGIPRSLIQEWIRSSDFTARLYAVEPPLVSAVGNGDNGIAVRYYENDPSLRVAAPAAQQLTGFSDVLGARGDREELLFFPAPEYYAAYRQAAGFRTQNAPAPGGYVGDAIDGRMLILSLPSQMILIPSGKPGVPARPAAFPSAAPNIMGRIHSQVLVNQIAGGLPEGEERVPNWLRMGMATYSAKIMSQALGGGPNNNENLGTGAAFGNLLSPADFQNLGNGAPYNSVAELQAGRLVEYFYTRFGPGRVVETLQRLGAGEAADDAMEATTNLTEEQFFTAWYNAETGKG